MSWVRPKYVLLVLLVAVGYAPCLESCIEEERLGLIEINSYMKSHVDPNLDQSYVGMEDGEGDRYNCCTWTRVGCNSTTGRIIRLDLSQLVNQVAFYLDGSPGNNWLFNVTLFHPFTELRTLSLSDNTITGLVESNGSTRISSLKNLQYLSLDGNDFHSAQIFLGALVSLNTLTLSGCGLNQSSFSFRDIANLRKLKSLDLSFNYLEGLDQGLCELRNLEELNLSENLLNSTLPSCVDNLTSLQVLDLSSNLFKGRFPSVISNLTSLQQMDLSDNTFEGSLLLSSLSNLSKLQVLQFSRSGLEVQTEDSSWRPTFQLVSLGLQDCRLNKPYGTFPNFLIHQYSLNDIDLSHNDLVGSFPTWLLNNNSNLSALILTNNSLTRSLTLPHSAVFSLEILAVSSNHLHGELPENIGLMYPNLNYLNMSDNYFDGLIPSSISHMGQLQLLDLSRNNFYGELPRGLLSHCNSLEYLKLSDNNLQGEITPEHMNLSKLSMLKLSNNSFGGTIKDSLLRSSDLRYLDISNNNIRGWLPRWIRNLTSLRAMLLSKNFLHGQIPAEICQLKLSYLDLSENNFTGSLPSCSNFSSLLYMHLHKNRLTGSIPNALSSCPDLRSLILSDNMFTGSIPSWIDKLSSLRILLLGGNNLHGKIPRQICQLGNVDILDLSRNSLHGGIPTCLQNMSFGQGMIGQYSLQPALFMYGYYGENNNIYVQEVVEVLAKNQHLSYAGGNHLLMSELDLSCNNLSGNIPHELGGLRELRSLNLSHNSLSGSIPSIFSDLKLVESLDLSYNNLSGNIPSQLVDLNYLAVFNVSYNNLTGETPETGQFADFDQSNFIGNPGLCGLAVGKSCHHPNKTSPPAINKEDENDGHTDFYIVDFLWSFGMSSVISLVTTVLVLWINTRWRGVLFGFVDWHVLWWLKIDWYDPFAAY